MPLLTIADLLNGDPAEIETIIGKASGISEMYEEYFAADRGDAHTRLPGIHASEVSGCERRIAYSLMGTPRVEQSASIWKRRFKMGHAVHKMLQDDFERMAGIKVNRIDFEPEATIKPCMDQPLSAKWDIQSHTDGIFTLYEEVDGPPLCRMILEIKTEAPSSYEALKATRPDHIEQGTVYMACLDVPLIWFLYYNKGNQNFTPSTNPNFFLRFDPRIWEKLEARFERAHINAALKKLPEREESVKCEFCAFSHECKPATLNRRQFGHKSAPWGK